MGAGRAFSPLSRFAPIQRLIHQRQRFVRRCHGTEKAPTTKGRGKLSRAELSGLFGPIRSALTGWAERFLVTLPTSGDLFVYAKDLFVETNAPQAPTPKPLR